MSKNLRVEAFLAIQGFWGDGPAIQNFGFALFGEAPNLGFGHLFPNFGERVPLPALPNLPPMPYAPDTKKFAPMPGDNGEITD